MLVTELYAFNLICENLLAALYGVALIRMKIVIQIKSVKINVHDCNCNGAQSIRILLKSEMGSDWQRLGLELVQC